VLNLERGLRLGRGHGASLPQTLRTQAALPLLDNRPAVGEVEARLNREPAAAVPLYAKVNTGMDADLDQIFLEGFEVPCRVGCTPPERATLQSLKVDVVMAGPTLYQAGLSDDLSQTIDYRIATQMIAELQGHEYLLIERVAEVLAQVALRHPLVTQVQIKVRKRPPVQGLELVGVQITRRRPAQG
jgi:dihydroneopterin aldolase